MKPPVCSQRVGAVSPTPAFLSPPNVHPALAWGAEVEQRGQRCFSCHRAADLGGGNSAPSSFFAKPSVLCLVSPQSLQVGVLAEPAHLQG